MFIQRCLADICEDVDNFSGQLMADFKQENVIHYLNFDLQNIFGPNSAADVLLKRLKLTTD